MAEYKALAQNTYKFVTETIFDVVGDISTPKAPLFGRAKYINNLTNSVYYAVVESRGTATTAEANELAVKSYGDQTTALTSSSIYAGSNVNGRFLTAACVVDGKRYVGVRNSQYCLYKEWASSSTVGSVAATTSDVTFPACTIKAVIYDATSGTIKTATLEAEAVTLEPYTSEGASSTAPYVYQYVYLNISKISSDIVLAIEFEYPAYDITLNDAADGLQYSIDDGITFQDVTAGVSLEQVEHIIFQNTGESARMIGTTSGGSDVCEIAAGATYVAIPTADGTWYIT